MITRRAFLKVIGGGAAGALGLAGYAFGVEPALLMRTQHYRFVPPNWPAELRLRAVILADLHACRPWMTPERIEGIVAQANALAPDVIFLLGDYVAGMRVVTSFVHSSEWSKALAPLSAPLGVHAVLGNHDWWEDRTAQKTGEGPPIAGRALEAVGIPVLENRAVRLVKDGQAFWVAGLGDQIALVPRKAWGRTRWVGKDDLAGTLAQVSGDAPVILLAHEPDIFPKVPDRVSLTLSGHTHGGQVRLFGYSPVVPSAYDNRYAYGHVIEGGRHLVVSGGLGCSIMPVRFGVPPEITVVELGGADVA
jgi:predicted MPP superfamily phosphohydrolase